MAIITISRGEMSGGEKLASCLADVLGYRVMAREVLREAARNLGASPETLTVKYESVPGLWARLTHEREIYTLAVQTALLKHCIEGDLIYHGLAGRYFLSGLPGILRTRLIAPMEIRVKALRRVHHHLSPAAAEHFLSDQDQDHARWVRLMYGLEMDDSSTYDLILNLEAMSIDTVCAIIAEVVAEPAYQQTAEMVAEYEALEADCSKRLEDAIARRS
ncbi:AAA family ATPase [Gemmatimonadota bacterium]